MQCVGWQQCLPEGEGRNREECTGLAGKSSGAGDRWKLKLSLGVPLCHRPLLDLRLVTAPGLQAPEYKVSELLALGAYR